MTEIPPERDPRVLSRAGKQRRRLAQLSPVQRAALVLRFYLELSEAEIAQAMGISQGTVKSTVSRALAALGRLLEESQ